MCIFKVKNDTDSEDSDASYSVSTESSSSTDIEMPLSPPSARANASQNEIMDSDVEETDEEVQIAGEIPEVSKVEGRDDEVETLDPKPSGSKAKKSKRFHDGGEEDNEGEENEEDEDELVKSIRAELNKPRDHPPEIVVDDLVVDISFHPSSNILAVASITGDVTLYKYNNHANELADTIELHLKACRDIEFSDNGDLLYSCGKDRCIMITDTRTSGLKRHYENCHESPLYTLYEFDENILCSGDERGTVKVWDIRRENAVMTFNESEDFISDMITTDAKKYLVCSSGDGALTVFNMTARKLFTKSEDYDSELNCMQLCKFDAKLVVGSAIGKMFFFNWGQFNIHSDEYSDVKIAINSMISVTENMTLAAYDDGIIRAYNLYPNKYIGVVGQHRLSVEALDISHDGEFIASCSLDHSIKFWNIRYFEDIHVKKGKSKKRRVNNNLPSSNVRNTSDFFAGMV